jgi:hypothetical protein
MDVTRLDGELRLAIVKLVRPDSNADKANPILTESLGSAGALPLVLNHRINQRFRVLDSRRFDEVAAALG